jgi:Flp pilus assembly pilin Flp
MIRFLRDDSGQDLIEYAILTAVISVASLAVLAIIRFKMSGAYVTWGAQINDARFHPNDPITPFP